MTAFQFRKSWIDPQLYWNAPGKCLVVSMAPDSRELVEFFADNTIEVPFCPPDMREAAAILGHDRVRYRLLEGVHHIAPPDIVWDVNSPLRVFLSHAYHLPDDQEIVLMVCLDEPSESAQRLPPEVVGLFRRAWGTYQEKRADWERNEKGKRAGSPHDGDQCPEEPTLLSVIDGTRLLDTLPRAKYLETLPRADQNREQAIRRSIDSSEMAPSRDGTYTVNLGVDVAGQQVAVIAWEPEPGLPGYPEVRECLIKGLPTALECPRSCSITPPILLDPDSDFTISDADLSPLDRILDRDELISAADHRLITIPESAAKARGLIQQGGFEALGWYQGFHSWDERHWGIYLHADRIYDFACALHEDLSQTGNRHPALAIFLAVGLVYQHERFHARVEAAATWIEMLRRKPGYRAYHRNVYQRLQVSADWREEALANWTAVEWMRRRLPDWLKHGIARNPDHIERVVTEWLDLQPAGYRDWRGGQQKQTWRMLASELVTGKQGGGVRGKALPVEALLRGDLPFEWRNSDIPTRFVGSSLVSEIFFSSPSRREAMKVLAYYEYQVDTKRGKGSHEFWAGQDGRGFPLPMRDPLSITVFNKLLDHFGLTKKQYVSELRPLL